MPKGKQKAKQPRLVEQWDDASDDEEIPEDEAFDSDDDRKYGSFFDTKDEASGDGSDGDSDELEYDDDESGSDDTGDSDQGDGGEYMLDLLEKLDSDGKSYDGGKTQHQQSSNAKDAEFAAPVIQKGKITLDLLMEGLEDKKGFGLVQKKLRKIAQGSATSAPLSRVVSDRAQRKVHYEDQSKEVSLWMDAVKQNRQAETLDFRPKERLQVTRDVLIDSFVPTTDFEKAINSALEEAGQKDEDAILKAEEAALQDDLDANEITIEEFKQRRAQLAKMRALMFYYEQKRHHINKIKSKKYRRIRKRQRERQKDTELEAMAEGDADLARQLEEKEEVERMKERATLAHKNTSKWAKRILKRGKNVDKGTRQALSAQLKRGDDLLQRMKSTRDGGADDSDEDDLVETARKVLADVEDDAMTDPVQGKGLFQLSFMKKGVQRQREKARDEARQLLQELQAEQDDTDQSQHDDSGKGEAHVKMASKTELNKVLGKDSLVATTLEFGKTNSLAVSGNIDVTFHSPTDEAHQDVRIGTGSQMSEHNATFRVVNHSNNAGKEISLKPSVQNKISKEMGKEDESNPWLAVEESKTTEPAKVKHSARRKGVVDVEQAIELFGPTEGPTEGEPIEKQTSPSDGEKITTLTQEELVRRAFASMTEKEAVEEFLKEKELVEEEEDVRNKLKKEKNMQTVAGWGSWAGKGAPPPKSLPKLPKRLQPPEKKLEKRKRRDERKPDVIISEKRVRKTANAFMLSQVPYPFSCREDYERAMSGGLGREWNVTTSFKDMTRPEILTRSGKIIQPISKKVKQKRAAAKF